MKILDIPRSGKRGNIVSCKNQFGQYERQLIVPRNVRTPAREHMRGAFGNFARAWSRLLTQQQREVWNAAGPKVRSATRLGQSGPLTGQQHFQGINSARACIGREMLWAPPAPVVFSRNPVGQLTINNGDGGVRLLLQIAGPVTEDIMVFGQAPCSAGRAKRRNVAYLGLLPALQGGMSDITDMYVARYGEPRAGEKVFIVTRQQKDGWEAYDHETNEIVPGKAAGQQAAGTVASTLQVYMYKGCTRDAQGIRSQSTPNTQESSEGGAIAGAASVAPVEGCVVAGVAEIVSKPAIREGQRPREPKLLWRLWKSLLAKTFSLPGLGFQNASTVSTAVCGGSVGLHALQNGADRT